jgi:hypothetical protein
MPSDIVILRRALDIENDTRRPPRFRHWEYHSVGASKDDIKRLQDQGYVFIEDHKGSVVKYKLTEKGKQAVWAESMERQFTAVSVSEVLDALDLVIGFEDIKLTIAQALAARRRINFLLEGPPACAKSVILDGVRNAVPEAYLAFGSRTSAAGISDVLFEQHPPILLLDEVDKMDKDSHAVLLGLMESGEVLETKSRKTRGVTLDTLVIAACNSSRKFTKEFKSRFAFHPHFPEYTHEEFVDVVIGMLTKREGAPEDIARVIGEKVYEMRFESEEFADVRKARGVWQLMMRPTEEEVDRVVQMMLKYKEESEEDNGRKKKKIPPNQGRLLK